MKKQKILLAGATGYLGQFIAKELIKELYPSRLVVRNNNKAQFSTDDFEIVEAELTKNESILGVCKGVDVVISTVGITKQKDGLTYMCVDYGANMNLLKQAKACGVKKFIYVSAFNADKLCHLKMTYAKEMFVDALKNSGLEYCIIRPNGFYSDMTEFIKMAKKGTVHLFGDGNFKMNPIHGEDLAKLCVAAIASPENEIEVGGPEVFTHNEIAEMAFNVVGKNKRIKYMPEFMRKMALWVLRTFTSSKTYGPFEFFMTVLAMDMVAPAFGERKLLSFFEEAVSNKY